MKLVPIAFRYKIMHLNATLCEHVMDSERKQTRVHEYWSLWELRVRQDVFANQFTNMVKWN